MGNSQGVKVIPVLLRWSIKTDEPDFPSHLVTFSPGQDLGNLPLEVGILLPTVPGNRVILETLQQPDINLEKTALGIFAADHFLNLDSLLPKLRRAKVSWVCNLPTLAQYEPNFRLYLSEIELTPEQEAEQLARCRDAGFNTLLAISGEIDRTVLENLRPDAIAIVPSVAEFSKGFPTLERLKTIEAEIKQDLTASGFKGTVLSYREQSDNPVGPCLCRPTVIEPTDLIQT